MFPYDSAILAAVGPVPQTIPDVFNTMQAIDGLCADGDGLKWFNRLYLQVTQAVEARVNAGGFSDPVWLAELDVQFARLYFAALESSLSGQAPADCWQVLFERRNQVQIARIQFALAGVNAHINYDLPSAIVATCVARGDAPDRDDPNYADYTALNTTLDALIETAKQELNVRLPGDALPPVSRLEDTIAAWDVSAAREGAWVNAEQLWHYRGAPLLESGFEDMLDGMTAVIGKTLLVPVP